MGDLKNIDEVELIQSPKRGMGPAESNAARLAAEIAARVGGSTVRAREPDGPDWAARLRPGQLCVASATSWQLLASSDPPPGSAIVIALESGAPWQTDGGRQLV